MPGIAQDTEKEADTRKTLDFSYRKEWASAAGSGALAAQLAHDAAARVQGFITSGSIRKLKIQGFEGVSAYKTMCTVAGACSCVLR